MSPITRETLAARIATLEADSNISIKEGFYLQTMRLLLAEMNKPAPHHNGMMQLSNELADLKRNHAELQAVVDQRNGECDRLINEKQTLEKQQADMVMLVKVLVRTVKKYNHGSATDFLCGGVLSAHEHVAAVLELIGSFDASDIEGDTVELRFEVDGVDTGADVSITEYATRGAAIIRRLTGSQGVKLALDAGMARYGDAMQELAKKGG